MRRFLGALWLGMLSCCCLLQYKAVADPRDSVAETDCKACSRLALVDRCTALLRSDVWPGCFAPGRAIPLYYFTDSLTYLDFNEQPKDSAAQVVAIDCPSGKRLWRKARIDTQPFHMENKMDFVDSTGRFFQRPSMLCSDVEAMIRFVPDFQSTEQWVQLVMHEYFHSWQFSQAATRDFLADSIRMAADTLISIYHNDTAFQAALSRENDALLRAIRAEGRDSSLQAVADFFRERAARRAAFRSGSSFGLEQHELFWETIEGTARYAEYYLAGHFAGLAGTLQLPCDSLFRDFRRFSGNTDYRQLPEFLERERMMPAYYYVTGFNLCRLLDKLKVEYKNRLFKDGSARLEVVLREVNSE